MERAVHEGSNCTEFARVERNHVSAATHEKWQSVSYESSSGASAIGQRSTQILAETL